MTLSALGIFSAAGAGGAAPAGAYELISTTILGSNQPSVTFSNLGTYSSTYKHLQIRMVSKTSDANSLGVLARFNSDTGSNYSWHVLLGNGSAVSSSAGTSTTFMYAGIQPRSVDTANAFGASVMDILDPYSTSKNKTIRSLSGVIGSRIDLYSGNWRNTNSLTTIDIIPENGSFITASRFSLYGIRG
jgi:hypothetical protein